MEMLGFAEKEMRDEQYRRFKAQGYRGLGRHSTHHSPTGRDEKTGKFLVNPSLVYVLTYCEPDAPINLLHDIAVAEKLCEEFIEKAEAKNPA